jgi:hypothetical protein
MSDSLVDFGSRLIVRFNQAFYTIGLRNGVILSPSNFLLFPPVRINQLFRAIIKAEKPTYRVEAILTTSSSSKEVVKTFVGNTLLKL